MLAPLLLILALLAPPSGRPPTGPLTRYEPRAYKVGMEVTVSAPLHRNAGYQTYLKLRDTPIVVPVVFMSTWSQVDPDSLHAQLWYGTSQVPGINERSRLDVGFPFNTQLAVMTIPSFEGQSLRWRLDYQSRVYSSRIDDAAAAKIAWPREWPKEVQDGLQPQMYIESDNPLFRQTVERISEGNLRTVPPYLAAKDLIRYCINEVQVVGDGLDRRALGMLHGLEMEGALVTARTQKGSMHDLVCICVAVLRAANIPARPVIGVQENERGVAVFVSWAEFYLPNAGWVPFDPEEMRGKGIRSKNVRDPWPEFGTMDDLNRRVPLAYHFIPPAKVETPQSPAVWGWDPRPRTPNAEQVITLSMVSRGRVPDDATGGGQQ